MDARREQLCARSLLVRIARWSREAPPNTRMQRTRSSPSALRSPPMRCPLGGGKSRCARQFLWSFGRLFLAVAVFSAVARVGAACSCVEYLTDPIEALNKSSLVFSGEVVSVSVVTVPVIIYWKDDSGELAPFQSMDRKGVVTLRVLKEWKGSGAKEYVVLAGAPPVTPLPVGEVLVDCQEHLAVGQRYLIFVEQYGYAEVNPCAPTLELGRATAVVAALDANAKTKPAQPSTSAPGKGHGTKTRPAA